tara:strand:- start:10019 stop:11317 length:1299 start_codon:yes stop_codon:yes gene_type:complete
MTEKIIIFNNATLIDPENEKEFSGSLLVKNGIIENISRNKKIDINSKNSEIIDCKKHTLSPGLIDLWVFAGEPGYEHNESIESISNISRQSGVTTIACRPDTSPIIDEVELVDYIKRKSLEKSKINIHPIAALTKNNLGEIMTEIGLLQGAGAIGFSNAYNEIKNTQVLKNAFLYAANFDALIIQQCINDLDNGGVMNESETSMRLGLSGMPQISETIALERELRLVEETKTRYHSACISTEKSLNIIKSFKEHIPNLSCGVSINNLILNENDIGAYRTFFKLKPPLRNEKDREILCKDLNGDTIDVITSNHDPQGTESKRRPFSEAAFGAVGIETLLSASLSLYHQGYVTLPKLMKKLTYNPAKILNLESGRLEVGKPADLILFNKDQPWILKADNLISKCKNTTFENQKMQGKVFITMVNGEIVYNSKNI